MPKPKPMFDTPVEVKDDDPDEICCPNCGEKIEDEYRARLFNKLLAGAANGGEAERERKRRKRR
jgi:transposase